MAVCIADITGNCIIIPADYENIFYLLLYNMNIVGGSQSHSHTYEQAHTGLDPLTLVSL